MSSKRTLLTLLALCGTGVLTGYAAGPDTTAPAPEEAAVREAVQYYMDGQATGDGAIAARAFHEEAHLTYVREGRLQTIPVADYLARFSGEPAGDEAQRDRWIESVDIAGDAAVAKVILDYPGRRYTDYMSLLKVGDEWKIIHKNFTSAAK